VRWLGFEPSAVLYSADYFPRMYELAERLVLEGKAYVDDSTDEQIKEMRGTLSEPGTPSPNRDRTPEDNLALLRKMKAGDFPDGACVLRAKIDLASSNMKMRDPLLYRIRHAHHHRSGDAWKIYPMYDYAHPLEDAIEGITHSICTLEFENNRELYDWVLEHTGPWKPLPKQYEMARLVLDYTVMSKRKLLTLVTGKHVNGWDDPRMPTIAGMRRRGYSPEALRAFCDMIGVAKANSTVDIGKLEYCLRDDLNKTAPRVMGVLRPIEVELVGWSGGSETIDAPYWPKDIVGKTDSRDLSISGRVLIDRDDWSDDPPKDYQRLAPNRTVRLRHAYCITATDVIERDADGNVTKLRATVHLETKGGKPLADGKKPAGVIHWVDAATALSVEARNYDRLFAVAKPEEGGVDFLQHINPSSLEIVMTARVEASLANAPIGSRWQLERVGYFTVDKDSTPGALVLNRTITLRDTKVSLPETVPIAESVKVQKNPKAQSRPKGKSPQEYRAEARVRDASLAAAFDAWKPLIGEEYADLLSGDVETKDLFTTASANVERALAAKWMVNELPRALGERELSSLHAGFGGEFGALLAAVEKGELSPTAGKSVLAELVRTGKPFSELRSAATAPAVDLGSAVDAVIAANPDKAAQYKAGKTGLLGFFVGQVMKASPNADASAVNQAVRDRLS
jgi:glutaminyl-tRNA synthetase